MHGDVVLPDWLENGVESSLRDTQDDAPPPPVLSFSSSSSHPQAGKGPASSVVLAPYSSAEPSGPPKPRWENLDKFYDDEEESQSESEEGDEDSDGEDGEGEEGPSSEAGSEEEEESEEEEPQI